jgi:hypothetical protein
MMKLFKEISAGAILSGALEKASRHSFYFVLSRNESLTVIPPTAGRFGITWSRCTDT